MSCGLLIGSPNPKHCTGLSIVWPYHVNMEPVKVAPFDCSSIIITIQIVAGKRPLGI